MSATVLFRLPPSIPVAKNPVCAKIFYDIAGILELQGVEWKPVAYRKAARTIESLSEDVEDIYKRGGLDALMELPGVGEALAKKIEEIVKTGRLRKHEELKRSLPEGLVALTSVPGLGPKKAKRLYDELGVKSLEGLKKAAEDGKIHPLEGFGYKSEQDVLRGLAFLEKGRGRALLGYILPEVREIVALLKKSRFVERAEPAGSVRRMKESVGDVDMLVTSSQPGKVMDYFVSLPMVGEVVAKGPTKTAVRLKSGLGCDIRVVEGQSFGAALQYFTGSKDHNIALRRIAISKGWKLSEYGVFKGAQRIAGKSEEEVYSKLGLAWVPPELRENMGEVEAAQKGKLPHLVEQKDIRGDFHCHTKWSDGSGTVLEMATAAAALGYEYLFITDHASAIPVAHGLDRKRFAEQAKEMDAAREKLGSKIELMQGTECDINRDGSLWLDKATLRELDLVIASVHTSFTLPRDEMTKRVVTAIEGGQANIIGHPSGRLIGEREAYQLDYDKVFEAAARSGVFIEINALPERLDLRETEIKRAKEYGVKFTIGTDSHAADNLHFMELGVAMARRGWCEKADILNAQGIKALKKLLR